MTYVTYSYRHSCMVTLTVGDTPGDQEWHLPTFDPRNENKYHYKLHSLDIYFWTQNDALQFLNNIRRILPASQIDVQDEPGTSSVAMSPIVQQLENTVLSDPIYSMPNAIPGPPPGAPPGASPIDAPLSAASGHSSIAPAVFVPMAYNPAAPAAPEQHQAREKTPPPEEDTGNLNPLAAAMAVDYQMSPFTPGFRLPPNHPAANGLASPRFPTSGPMGFAPPPQVGIQRAATMPASPYISIPPPQLQTTGMPSSIMPAAPPPAPAPMATYNAAALPQNLFDIHEHKANPLYNPETQVPAPLASPPLSADYSLHGQAYAGPITSPTFGPQQQKQQHAPQQHQPAAPAQTKSGSKMLLEEKTARFEKGVSGMLRKFEKKFG